MPKELALLNRESRIDDFLRSDLPRRPLQELMMLTRNRHLRRTDHLAAQS